MFTKMLGGGATRTGWFNMAMHWSTLLFQCSSFWLLKM